MNLGIFGLAQAAGVGWMTSYHSWIIPAGTFVFGDSIVLAASGPAARGRWPGRTREAA